MSGRRRLPWGRFLSVASLVGLDLWSKYAVFHWLSNAPAALELDAHGHLRHPLIEPWFGLMLSCNPGAAFGRFGDYPHALVLGRVVAIGVLSWLLWHAETRHRVTFVAMVLVLAGALGNLVDNLGLGCVEEGHPYGLVRDFIDVWFVNQRWGWDWHFPTFNVADSCISVGAVGWVAAGLFHRKQEEDGEARE